MSSSEVVEDCTATCPACGKPVEYKWVTGNGFVSEPHNLLIADSVFHASCWEGCAKEVMPADAS